MKKMWKLGLAALMAAGFSVSSQAVLSITPGSTYLVLTGNETGQNEIDAAIDAWLLANTDCEVDEVYKQDVGAGSDTGTYADDYMTTFDNEPTDPEDALIEWVGPDKVDSDCMYLLVKDGNAEPAWYFFDLGAALWDGEADLEITGFWPNQGSISHVSIYAGEGTSVPDGAQTSMLLGAALLALGGLKRYLVG